jgi:hypothetical protein
MIPDSYLRFGAFRLPCRSLAQERPRRPMV